MNSPITNHYAPDFVTPPGDTLLETLNVLGMTQTELAERTGRPKKTINEIINGKTAITPETALQFERVLGVPASFWNSREQQYRASLAKQAEQKALQAHPDWLKQFPVREMIKRGWLTSRTDNVEQLQEVLGFFGIATPSQWDTLWSATAVSYRQSKVWTTDPYILSVWLRRGQIEAQQVECAPYNPEGFELTLRKIRLLTDTDPDVFQPETIRLCAQEGVAVVFVPELPRVRVNGATYWYANKPVIQLSLRYKSDDQLWFTFFHEAGHILKHGKRNLFIEANGDEDEKEAEANRFASDMLIPPEKYHQFHPRGLHYSKAEIIAFAHELGIAPGIVVGRLQHDHKLPNQNCNDLKRRLLWVDDAG